MTSCCEYGYCIHYIFVSLTEQRSEPPTTSSHPPTTPSGRPFRAVCSGGALTLLSVTTQSFPFGTSWWRSYHPSPYLLHFAHSGSPHLWGEKKIGEGGKTESWAFHLERLGPLSRGPSHPLHPCLTAPPSIVLLVVLGFLVGLQSLLSAAGPARRGQIQSDHAVLHFPWLAQRSQAWLPSRPGLAALVRGRSLLLVDLEHHYLTVEHFTTTSQPR